jgi:hypothetical protein
MLFMVIERFRDNDMVPVYQRVRQKGRSLPKGLEYMSTAGSRPTFPAASSSCAATISV